MKIPFWCSSLEVWPCAPWPTSCEVSPLTLARSSSCWLSIRLTMLIVPPSLVSGMASLSSHVVITHTHADVYTQRYRYIYTYVCMHILVSVIISLWSDIVSFSSNTSMYTYMFMRTIMYTHTHTHTHTHTQAQTHTCTHTCIHTHIYTRSYLINLFIVHILTFYV